MCVWPSQAGKAGDRGSPFLLAEELDSCRRGTQFVEQNSAFACETDYTTTYIIGSRAGDPTNSDQVMVWDTWDRRELSCLVWGMN